MKKDPNLPLQLKGLYPVIWLLPKGEDYYVEKIGDAWLIRKKTLESGLQVQIEESVVQTMIHNQWIRRSADGTTTYRLTKKGRTEIDQVLVARNVARELEGT